MADIPQTLAAADAGDAEPPDEVAGRWQRTTVLKSDVFSTVERGEYAAPGGKRDAVLRRIDGVPWWTRKIATHLLRREARALTKAGPLGLSAECLFDGRGCLVRSWLPGLPLHLAQPRGDRAFFASAARLLRRLHRNGITHNDLAKEQNWLRSPRGEALLTDFQLAVVSPRRGKLFRILAHEDIRHLLKHKRTYAPEALTPIERRILKRKSLINRFWMATGKRLYLRITRGVFRFRDSEGRGARFVDQVPVVLSALATFPLVRRAAVVPVPNPTTGTGVYLFAETEGGVTSDAIRAHIRQSVGGRALPDLIQTVRRLPAKDGQVRLMLLELIAMNQIDQLAQLVESQEEQAVVDGIVAGRLNLRDRFIRAPALPGIAAPSAR